MGSRRGLLKPPLLMPGDTVGLVAPSSPFRREALEQGASFLEGQGFRVRYDPALFERRQGFLAGRDQERAEEIQRMFEDRLVRAVFVVRGGYGAQRILEGLDPDRIRRHPKIFLGYSDATCLLGFLLQSAGMVCFHGPVVTEMGSIDEGSWRFLMRLVTRAEPAGPVPLGDVRWIRRGEARGPIVGGNLSLVCSTLGTPWELDTAGKILLLEDRGERPYRVDRMLVQLRQAGKLSGIAGLLFGSFAVGSQGGRSAGEQRAMEEVLQEHGAGLGVPVAWGLPVGHGTRNVPLPLGIRAEINGAEGRVSILESAVEPQG